VTIRGWLVILLLILVGVGGTFAWLRFESEAPQIAGPESVVLGGQGGNVALELSDAGAGLRSVQVVLLHAAGELDLLSESYPGSTTQGAQAGKIPVSLEIAIEPDALPRAVTEAFLRVRVRDWSLRDSLRGNLAELKVPISIDRRPPRVAITTGLTYVRRGGSGVVRYELDEETARDGVQVGETFFPGYEMNGSRVAFYAIPTDTPDSPELRVIAEDTAGNVARARWPVVVKERVLPVANVTLPPSFLDTTVPDLAASVGIDASDPTAAFAQINTELRAANERTIREALAESAPERLWQGAFSQLANSKVTSRFAERRTYFVGGQPVSKATHFGYDLASTRAAPIGAAARGRVAFADELGIYGNCVLLDHGLGLASLYGHLSRLDVQAGDSVEAGQSLGLSGATGLAGGDHLHFAVLIGEAYVDPIEWWDEKWVRENIEARLPTPAP